MSVKAPEFKFIHYEPAYSDLESVYKEFSRTLKEFKKIGEENVAVRVLSYFYEGMLNLVQGDQLYNSKKYDRASKKYDEGLKLMVRSRASRGREGDQIFNEMIKWINYTEGMQRICVNFVEQNVDRKLEVISESILKFESFFNERKKEKNAIDEIIAKARISYAKYLQKKTESAKFEDNTKKYKKYLLKARTELMKANFFFRTFNDELEELQNLIDELTKQHIIGRAEEFWDRGTHNITVSNFEEAQRLFSVASEYYSRASEICANFMEQRLYLALSKITQASDLEAEANSLYKRKDKPKEASIILSKAVETVDLALGLLTSIKSESLIRNMTAQRSYYEALASETQGIYLFDQENFEEALEKFEEAMKRLEETQLSATEGQLEHLLEFVRTGKSEVEGYISMTKAMKS
ncbi:MAG: hypothetical protein KAS63_06730 [Candidatus Heimdallarchaeota archaeon]|nr:hypothetical protein [Candidatus Heimdallarchaeota archaeon]MCK4955039.1 hypothetical protein [Candidatus Heimdallarchaeota archaeon]